MMAQAAKNSTENISLRSVPGAMASNSTLLTSDHDAFSNLQAEVCLRWLSSNRYQNGDEYTVE